MIEYLKALHSTWNSVTGQELNYRATERLFWDLHNNDFTVEDLTIVLKHVQGYNKTHPNAQMKIQAHKLLGDLAVFGSICAEARAKLRNQVKPPTPKETILHEWRGVKPEGNGNGHCRPIADVFNAMREATKQ